MKKKIWLLPGILHWLISFLTDKLIITCEKTLVYLGWKAAFLIFILIFYQVLGLIFREFRKGNEAVRKICKYGGSYFLLMLVFLLLTWPGIWRIDEFTILRTARDLHVHYWQGYLTSVYYIFCLMMIPAPVSVILFMCLINSAVVGYLIYKLLEYTKGNRLTYLLYLPFLFFPVIDSNLYPMRMSVYAFLELLLLAKLCFWKIEDRRPGKKELGAVLLLAGIITCWRSESIYYLILFPVLLLMVLWKRVGKKELAAALLAYLACSVLLVGIQKVGEGEGRGDGYELTALIRPLTPLVVEAAYAGETDLIADIDKVVNCAYIFQGAAEGESGIGIFWRWGGEGLLKEGMYTREDYRAYKQAYYQLILRHPKVFLRERISTYLQSTRLLGRILENEPPMRPLNPELRYRVYSLLELRSFEDYYTQGWGAFLTYNSIWPSLILAVGAFLLLLRRQFVCAASVLMVFLKAPLVFLTAPSTLFMYYYSPYLCGWVFLFFAGILFVVRRGNKKKKEVCREKNLMDGTS